MFTKKTLRDIDVDGKRVLVRADFNVPLNGVKVEDDTRLRAALPTIKYLLKRRAKIILMSHLGRPKNGVDERLRLAPVAHSLSLLLKEKVRWVDEVAGGKVSQAVSELKEREIILLDNLRFHKGEKKNEAQFSKRLAGLADIYVDDAFGVAHRAHASTVGVPQYLPAVAGFLLEKEMKSFQHLLEDPEKPFLAVIGGNKVADKIGVIEQFLKIVDGILTGGGMCFTFLKAKGYNIGTSILEEEELGEAERILEKAESDGTPIYLPTDIVITKEIELDSEHKVVSADEIPNGWKGVDIGPATIKRYVEVLKPARTIFWNGPMGVFEVEPFSKGTKAIAKVLAESSASTIVGGGDSDCALRKLGLEEKISFVSTGGGASLKVLEGSKLPGVEALLDE